MPGVPVRCVAFDADDTLWDFTTAMWEALDRALQAGGVALVAAFYFLPSWLLRRETTRPSPTVW